MRLKTFTAPDIHQAMAQIREALGEDAVIISTTRDASGKGVSVTAAMESDDPILMDDFDAAAIAAAANDFVPQPRSAEAKVLIELKAILAYHSVPSGVTDKLLETADMLNFEPDATFEGIRKTLRKVLEARFQFLPLPMGRAGFRLMLVGAPGVGKTMTIAKMAAQLVMDKKPVTVISTDTKRAGGVEQLQAFTDILNLELKVAETRAQMKQILQDASEEDRILIDSSGANPYDAKELKDLSEFLGLGNVEPVLVIPAGGDAQEAAHYAKAFGFTNAKRILVTRADISRRYGSILSAASAGEYAFCNSSSTSKVVGEYRNIDAEFLSHLLMQYRLEE